MSDPKNDSTHDPNESERRLCARPALLLSLQTDGAATEDQVAELARHLPGCEDCRRAAAADAAVSARLTALATPQPRGGSAAFTARTVAAALAERVRIASQNRFLRITAAAAVLVTVLSGSWLAAQSRGPSFGRGGAESQGPDRIASARLTARSYVVRPELPGLEEK